MRWPLLSILFLSFYSWSQADSLEAALEKEKDPKGRIELLWEISDVYHNPEGADLCLNYLSDALRLAQSLNDPEFIGRAHMKLGRLYYHMENGPAAIDNFNKAILRKGSLATEEVLHIYNELGVIYTVFSESEKAVINYKEALKLAPEVSQMNGKSYEWLNNNVALCYMDMYEFDSSWIYHQKTLTTRLIKQDTFGLGQTYNNLGSLFYKMEEYDSSLFYVKKGLEMRQIASRQVPTGIIESKINIGKALLALNRYPEATRYLEMSRKEAIDLGNPDLEMRSLEYLMLLYAQMGKYKQAYESCKTYYEMRDNHYGLKDREEIIRLNHENLYNQKLRHDSIINAEKERLAEIETQKEQELQEQKEAVALSIQIGLGVGLVLSLSLLYLAMRSYRQKKKSEEEIRKQKSEAEKQRDRAEIQKRQLEVINQEITDSIQYAQRIQSAILPHPDLVEKVLQKHFIVYEPKAIVAGDFYWVYEVDGFTFFAAADCTGHGVPGAMVSVICSTALNRAMEEYHLRTPHEILDKASELITETFEQSGKEVKDGMDISLCRLQRETNELLYAGANNPLYVYRHESGELEEIKATKQAVGLVDNRKPFEVNEIRLFRNDVIYSFTDGFADQFGGPKGKKYKYSNFKSFLRELKEIPMMDQGDKIQNELAKWMGDLEQVDDICIIGVKIT